MRTWIGVFLIMLFVSACIGMDQTGKADLRRWLDTTLLVAFCLTVLIGVFAAGVYLIDK